MGRLTSCFGLLLASIAGAQTFDFENSLEGWTADPVFAKQPVNRKYIRTGQIARVSLGGDYWRDLMYPMGQHGEWLIATSDAGVGVLISPEFRLSKERRWFSALVGGTDDVAHERVELQVRYGDEYVRIFFATGRAEALQQESFQVPEYLDDHPARLVILDQSPAAHINVDYLRFEKDPPAPRQTPVWGYADYHTHPMTYLAFGALQEKARHAIWGNPGGSIDLYGDPTRICADIPHCVRRHSGGTLAELFLSQAQQVSIASGFKWTLRAFLPHGRSGGPEYKTFPAFYRGAHEQMHVTQIYRNYQGGLRLMVGLVTDNFGAEYLMSEVREGKITTARPIDSLEAQVRGMVRMAEANRDWMEIAHSAEQARDIILRNKLAVVMGVEIDKLGELDIERFQTAADEVEYLWGLGIRAVTPIHAVNNKIGGPAVFENAYNWDNDLMHRDKTDIKALEALKTPPAYFKVMPDESKKVEVGETVQFRLDESQFRVALVWLLRRTPFIVPYKWPEYAKDPRGQRNVVGIERYGTEYLRALMAKGMIVDIAHMSQKSVDDTLALTGERYPTIVSHAHFRAQAHYDAQDNDVLPSEYDISNSTLERVRRGGGVVGPFVTESRMDPPQDQGEMEFDNDCTMSSKSFGYSYRYARLKMQENGVGMATDFTLIPGVAPRFGSNACAGNKVPKAKSARKRHPNERWQDGGIVYAGMKQSGYWLGDNAPLKPYRMGDHTYDFNTEGLAHYGLVPDLLQDLKNIGMPEEDREKLFQSSEGYLRMWEKAERGAGSVSAGIAHR